METNFDAIIDRRGTDSLKWDQLEALFGSQSLLPMWVADTDFPCPTPVVDAIKKRLDHPIFGYSLPSDSCYQAIVTYLRESFGWQIEREWIIFTHGVVDGIHSAIRALTQPGDGVILQAPVYHPFYAVIKNNGCNVLNNPLINENGHYKIDFKGLETHLIQGAKTLLLCSPHNPVSRVWTKEELTQLSELCLQYKCHILSDEIHCDLVYKPHVHTPTATLNPAVENITLTLYAPSKTYNIPGLTTAFAIIPNPELRKKYLTARMDHHGGNLLGYIALEAAYTHSEPYLRQLLPYLKTNIDLFQEGLRTILPQSTLTPIEGTYLAWVDMRGLGLPHNELKDRLINRCRLALNQGTIFGPEGKGYFRFNLGCPKETLKTALKQLERLI